MSLNKTKALYTITLQSLAVFVLKFIHYTYTGPAQKSAERTCIYRNCTESFRGAHITFPTKSEGGLTLNIYTNLQEFLGLWNSWNLSRVF